MLKTRIAFAFVLALTQAPLSAEPRTVNQNAHGWFNYFGDHPLGKSKWGVHLEAQYRRHDVLLSWQQLLVRPAMNYDVNPALTLSAGYAFARSYSFGNRSPATPAQHEHRLWEQALWRYRAGPAALTSRFRMEQRFLGSADPSAGYRYENRFRAWEQVTIPLGKRTYWTAYNEIWFYVKPYVARSVLDQNRAYAAMGIHLKPGWRLELGYMNQAVFQRSGSALDLNHTMMVSIFSNARFKLP
ncbi:MAG: DUF2490 domain-containing protein [Acidobacteriota bacterium]